MRQSANSMNYSLMIQNLRGTKILIISPAESVSSRMETVRTSLRDNTVRSIGANYSQVEILIQISSQEHLQILFMSHIMSGIHEVYTFSEIAEITMAMSFSV